MLTGRPWSNSPGLLPVRAHYVFLCSGLSSVHTLRESTAISNWQSRGKTMAQTILVEYLIEYHSSVLIKLDGAGQQPIYLCSYVCSNIVVFFFTSGTISSCCISKFTWIPPPHLVLVPPWSSVSDQFYKAVWEFSSSAHWYNSCVVHLQCCTVNSSCSGSVQGSSGP